MYNLSDDTIFGIAILLDTVILLEKFGAKKANEGLCSISAVVYRRKYS